MLGALAKAVFGSSNDRYVKSLDKIVAHDQRARAAARGASPTRSCAAQTAKFREQLAGGQDARRHPARSLRHRARGLASACSACATSTCRWSAASCSTAARSPRCAPARARRWSRRSRPISTRIEGKGVHVVTVNDYLARRDAEWMGQIHQFLGLTVGVIVPNLPEYERREAYAADITYGTNNEFGFDYLRDNMKHERGAAGAPPVQLRDRRRGRFDPDRRGAHAADHLGPDRGQVRPLHDARRAGEDARPRSSTRPTRRPRTSA